MLTGLLGKWNNHPENILFKHLRSRPGKNSGIFKQIPYTRAQFIGQPHLFKNSGNNRIFRTGGKVVRVNEAVTNGPVSVLCKNPAFFNDNLGWKCLYIFTVNQNIGSNLPHNFIPHTDALGALQIKGIGKMFLSKSDNSVITFDQVGPHIIPVIITVKIIPAQNQVGFVVGYNRQDRFILAE